MKKLAILTAALAILLLGVAQVAMATSLLDGTVDTKNNPQQQDVGYQYSYLLSTTTLTPGTGGITLSGRVSGLSFGAYNNWLEIGLVTQTVADAALASNPLNMNNQSAYFLVGKSGDGIYFEAGDYANCYQDYRVLGWNVEAFDFKFEVLPDAVGPGGTVKVTIPNPKYVPGNPLFPEYLISSLPYGVDNPQEFSGNAYVVVHAFAQLSDDPRGGIPSSVYADVNVVPLPGTLVLLGSGLAGLAFYRQRRAMGRKS